MNWVDSRENWMQEERFWSNQKEYIALKSCYFLYGWIVPARKIKKILVTFNSQEMQAKEIVDFKTQEFTEKMITFIFIIDTLKIPALKEILEK